MSGEPRFPRESFNREGYERELAAMREVLDGPKVSAPDTALHLAQLERLISMYPDHARRLIAELPPPRSAPP